jgi:hypothetical protein
MFARKLSLVLRSSQGESPVPKQWLDQFFMRAFTGYSAFDDTLPVADGILEAGAEVDLHEVLTQFEKWLRGRKMIAPGTGLLAGQM